MSLTAGTRLGSYEIQAVLGAGGMGEVYRARDTTLNRDVAIKIVPEALTADPGALARFQTEAQAVAALSHPNILGIFGTVLGTVGYMAPEQVRALEVDHRADIFALGAIVYEALAGRRAFSGASAVETMNAILKDDPPELTRANTALPPSLDRIVRRCLEKNPDERFQSARDLGFALEALSGTSVSSPAMAAASREHRWMRPVLAVIIAAAAVAGRWVLSPAVRQHDSGTRALVREVALPDRAGLLRIAGFSILNDAQAYAYTYWRRVARLFVVSGAATK